MAASVPRMRTEVFTVIRDLILEEETLRVRRGRPVVLDDVLFGGGIRRMGGGIASGSSQPWMDCLVRCLEMGVDE